MEAHMNAGLSAARLPSVPLVRFVYLQSHRTKLGSNRTPLSIVVPCYHFTSACRHSPLYVSSNIQEDVLRNNAGARMIKVKFVLRRRCEFGQHFYVIGNNQRLGAWDPEAAVPMQWSEGHVWTVELDLANGSYVEFKILIKAEQVVLEWQPGPNRKLEVSDRITPLLVYVPWSDEEEDPEIDASSFMEIDDLQMTQDILDTTSSARSRPETVGGMDLRTADSVSVESTDESKMGEMSDGSGTFTHRFEDSVHGMQSETEGRATEDRGLNDEAASLKSDLSPEEFFSLYPIPDSWYVEESRDVVINHDFPQSLPGSLEVNAPQRNLTSATELFVNKEAAAGDKLLLSNKEEELSTETMKWEANSKHISREGSGEQCMPEDEQGDINSTKSTGTILANAEPGTSQKGISFSEEENGKQWVGKEELTDAIALTTVEDLVSNAGPEHIQQGNALSKEENDKQAVHEEGRADVIAPICIQKNVSDAEPEAIQHGTAHSEEVNAKQHIGGDEPADAIATISKAEPEDIHRRNALSKEESSKQYIDDGEPAEKIASSSEELTTQPREDLMVEPAVLQYEKCTAREHSTSPENEENGIPSVQSDPEIKPAKQKKGGRKGWSKLWIAFNRGRRNE